MSLKKTNLRRGQAGLHKEPDNALVPGSGMLPDAEDILFSFTTDEQTLERDANNLTTDHDAHYKD